MTTNAGAGADAGADNIPKVLSDYPGGVFSTLLAAVGAADLGRGLHSLTSKLNLSAIDGIGVAHRGSCVARDKGVLGDV
jgi:hypothetical protein